MYPLLDEKRKTSDLRGWYSTCVITSESSSIFGGFKLINWKATVELSKFQRLTHSSSADKKFSPSGLELNELMLN